MAPNSRIILTRHAQAEHNVDLDYTIPDAPLTPLGLKQAASLVHQVPTSLQKEVDLVVTSPLKRTLQTTKLGWAPTIQRLGGLKNVICIPQAQECNDFPCDTGSAREVLEKDPEFKDFDLSLLTPDWNGKQGFYSADRDVLLKRGEWVRKWLLEREERVIVLVAHGDILRQITATKSGAGTHGWLNAEAREYVFDQETLDGKCFLRQEEEIAVAGGYGPTSTEADIVTGKL